MRPRHAQVRLAQRLERQIADADFSEILDGLISAGLVKRIRGGPGGMLSVVEEIPQEDPKPAKQELRDLTLERHLMPGVQLYLNGVFAASEAGLSKNSKVWLKETAEGGPTGNGAWSRPDFTMATVTKYRFSQKANLDLFGFELKPESRCDVRAVHEAYAQTRFVHYAYLVWHLPEGSRYAAKLAGIKAYCSDLGIGLISFTSPDEPSSFSVTLDPIRKSPAPEAIEAFIENRFSGLECSQIEAALRD